MVDHRINNYGAKSNPIRTCIVCRKKEEKSQLARFVLGKDNLLVIDADQKLPGRGAYTCVDNGCLLKALKKRHFLRALNGRICIDDQEVLLNKLAELPKQTNWVD